MGQKDFICLEYFSDMKKDISYKTMHSARVTRLCPGTGESEELLRAAGRRSATDDKFSK